MPLKYPSGEEILKGDRVRFFGEPGEVVMVVDGLVGEGENDWHMKEHGPGVMVREPKYFGVAYITTFEKLDFVGRGQDP